MRVVVIGAGVLGCSTALALARRRHAVVVVDRHGEVGHGSTSASCGIVRRFYSEAGMSAMAHESAAIWADWGAWLGPVGEDLAVFHRPGVLLIPPAIDDGVRRIVESMRGVGVDAAILDTDEIAARFPFLDTSSHHPARPVDDDAFFEPTGRRLQGAVFERDGGYVVSPTLATHNLRLAAEREGARFALNREVTEIRRTVARRGRGGFEVVAGGETFEAGAVVNIAGPHSSVINAMAGVELELELRALRREVHAVTNPVPQQGAVPVVGDLDSGVYFRPESGGRDLIVGSADPVCDEKDWVDPDDCRQGVTDRYWQRQCLRLMKRFPQVRLDRARGLSALYDVTVRDWYPVVDRTSLPGFYICAGTSGSSFKTAPVLGGLVADLIEANEGGRDTDADPLQLALPRIGRTIDTRFLSRLRRQVESTGTVFG